MKKSVIFQIVLIVLGTIILFLSIASLLVIKWKNLVLGNIILMLILASLNSISLINSIYIMIREFDICGNCSRKTFAVLSFLLEILVSSFCISELITFLISSEKVNYPCKKDPLESNTGGESYYYVYYYYRRMSSDFNCKDLPEDYYTGIVTKKECTIAYTTLGVSLFLSIIACVFWYLLIFEFILHDYPSYSLSSCCCCLKSDFCSCSCCKKKRSEKKVVIGNNDINNIKTLPGIDISPTVQESKEPV